MGMFDSVIVKCPNCKHPVEFQSKAGECILDRFPDYSVPVEIAYDIDGESTMCEECSAEVTIRVLNKLNSVYMVATTDKMEEQNEEFNQ